MARTARTTLADGSPVPSDGSHKALKVNGQQLGYVVLSEEERARGFVRPVRDSYRHVGPPGPTFPLADLTAEQEALFGGAGYVKYEAYPPVGDPARPDHLPPSGRGRFWTRAQLDAVNRGCGAVTTMGRAIAETYAREPGFYGATFCVGCRAHLAVGRNGEFVWDGTDERVGT